MNARKHVDTPTVLHMLPASAKPRILHLIRYTSAQNTTGVLYRWIRAILPTLKEQSRPLYMFSRIDRLDARGFRPKLVVAVVMPAPSLVRKPA